VLVVGWCWWLVLVVGVGGWCWWLVGVGDIDSVSESTQDTWNVDD
jgi:hypothetical protein